MITKYELKWHLQRQELCDWEGCILLHLRGPVAQQAREEVPHTTACACCCVTKLWLDTSLPSLSSPSSADICNIVLTLYCGWGTGRAGECVLCNALYLYCTIVSHVGRLSILTWKMYMSRACDLTSNMVQHAVIGYPSCLIVLALPMDNMDNGH